MEKDFKTNGHYFFNNVERNNSTCVIRFQKGTVYDAQSKSNSMYLWDDHFYMLDIETLFCEIIPEFDMFTCECKINYDQWNAIVAASTKYSFITQQIIKEMNEWMLQTIQEYGCVVVIGV